MGSVEENCRDWPHNWFGYFGYSEADFERYPEIPLIGDFVDQRWQHPERAKILTYLGQCYHTGWPRWPSQRKCELCEQMIHVNEIHFDGEWLWPRTLVHYVEKHSVRLPDRMIKRMDEHAFLPPPRSSVPLDELPWPRVREKRSFISLTRQVLVRWLGKSHRV